MVSAGVVAALLIGVAAPGVTAQSGPAARAAALLFGASTAIAQTTAPAAAGRHVIEGQVTKVDAKRGWVDVKTREGSMKLHFPSTALEGVKKGDSVSVEVAMTTSPAPARTDRAPRTK
jgi:hypothetical protein